MIASNNGIHSRVKVKIKIKVKIKEDGKMLWTVTWLS